MQLKDLGEFGLIKHLTKNMRAYDQTVVLGIGDDAAAFKVTGNKYMLATSDMLVEGQHFLLDKITPWQLGYKALAVSLSDIAAMGGVPRYALISVGWPAYIDLEYAEKLYAGIQELATTYAVNIIGGDTVKAPQLVLDVTVLGESESSPVTRSGAKPGDVIAVTGRLGAAGAGLKLLLSESSKKKLTAGIANSLITAHLKPLPRVEAAAILVKMGNPSAMIDISDGLASEVNHICASSAVGALIYADNLPVDKETRVAGKILEIDCLDWALYGGEDYELLVTLEETNFLPAQKALADKGVNFTVIGKVVAKNDGVCIMCGERKMPLTARGYNHFHEG